MYRQNDPPDDSLRFEGSPFPSKVMAAPGERAPVMRVCGIRPGPFVMMSRRFDYDTRNSAVSFCMFSPPVPVADFDFLDQRPPDQRQTTM